MCANRNNGEETGDKDFLSFFFLFCFVLHVDDERG